MPIVKKWTFCNLNMHGNIKGILVVLHLRITIDTEEGMVLDDVNKLCCMISLCS